MSQPSKASMLKAAAALLLAEILVFAIGVMPKHVATFSNHDSCELCALIHHPPVLETGQIAVNGLNLQISLMPAHAAEPTITEPTFQPSPSRAPPSLI